MKEPNKKLKQAREEFITQWGAMGSQWGISRTMAQVHALLMTSPEPLSTDTVMEALKISRGNAHSSLKELTHWGLVRLVVLRGERKDYYEALKDVWEMFTIIARERKRREIEPTLAILNRCAKETKDIKGSEAKAFHKQMKELADFVGFASKMSEKVASMKHGLAIQMATKFFK